MAMGRKKGPRQKPMWVDSTDVQGGPAHPFYRALSALLTDRGFDEFVEERCSEFYAEKMGRPSLPPGVYFRSLLVGFFEGIDSERGIAWRLADSLALREFLGFALTERTPDHSTLSGTRRRLSLQVHEEVFGWVLRTIAEAGLVKGKTLGVDATTLEANAALKSIVRREDGMTYNEFLEAIAKQSGIDTPTRADLARVDRKRPKKGSNDDWKNPHDPDAKITKMKDGRTHFAYRSEHVADLETTAILGVKVGEADEGDTASIGDSLERAQVAIIDIVENADAERHLRKELCAEIVADKGYHSNAVLIEEKEVGTRTYISEPARGKRNWRKNPEARDPTYANRRRIRGNRGKRLLRLRGERLERGFAHVYDTGGLRRLHVRGTANVAKRVLLGAAGFNIALLMRSLFGIGKPRRLQGRLPSDSSLLGVLIALLSGLVRTLRLPRATRSHRMAALAGSEGTLDAPNQAIRWALSTGC